MDKSLPKEVLARIGQLEEKIQKLDRRCEEKIHGLQESGEWHSRESESGHLQHACIRWGHSLSYARSVIPGAGGSAGSQRIHDGQTVS
ncbi:MAG: hypothetical protein GY801_48610 [bacterium]|nr:hypothetical protein [bacterium]